MIELSHFETTHVSGGVSSATILGTFAGVGTAIGAGTYYALSLAGMGGGVGGGLGAAGVSSFTSMALSGLAGTGVGLLVGALFLSIESGCGCYSS